MKNVYVVEFLAVMEINHIDMSHWVQHGLYRTRQKAYSNIRAIQKLGWDARLITRHVSDRIYYQDIQWTEKGTE